VVTCNTGLTRGMVVNATGKNVPPAKVESESMTEVKTEYVQTDDADNNIEIRLILPCFSSEDKYHVHDTTYKGQISFGRFHAQNV